MSRIAVAPPTLHETADRLRSAAIDARRVCEALSAAGPATTGSAELTAALREHAEAWRWCLEQAHDRARAAARALDTAARAYDRVECAVTDAAG
jgi:hypothetical protein